MVNNKYPKAMQIQCIEDWMEQFFHDSFYQIIDEQQFRVDLFETEHEYIVEAELPNVNKQHINITRHNNEVSIIVNKDEQEVVERNVTLPFSIESKEMKALFHNDILEIYISKEAKTNVQTQHINIQ
ncbi:Hsp20/alpha crystallin family protein [Bacillus sp. SM2101]|uniref:Hsp20/alpha crystallin family protein n=1 Tax=Bacillus sp. SM2101 TaxID=2805366 RepID=UPI001BDE89A8|nr:Hsp20/alpha crystallin family protein [Bacillus sp. SM2101]